MRAPAMETYLAPTGCGERRLHLASRRTNSRMSFEEEGPLTIPEIFGLVRSTDREDRLDGLVELAGLIDSAFGDDGARLREAVRTTDGVAMLAWLIVDPYPDVQQQALLVLGNLCSDACDPNSYLTKRLLLEQGAHRAMMLAIQGEDPGVLVYACGCLQNLCHDDEWARALVSHQVREERAAPFFRGAGCAETLFGRVAHRWRSGSRRSRPRTRTPRLCTTQQARSRIC